MRAFWTTLLLVGLVPWGMAGSVLAHAEFRKAEPAPDSTVRRAPRTVRIWFTQELRTKGSQISVYDADGRRVDDGRGGVDLDDLDRKVLLAKLNPVGPGRYTVKWRAVSVEDRDVTEGMFRFTVARAAQR